MALEHVPRCQHVKVNGVQCGSPALRKRAHCYFHTRTEHERQLACEDRVGKRSFGFPVLEDANSIQVALMKVIQMLGAGTLDHRTAALMLYGLQTASYNLRNAKFEPEKLTDVVIDEDTVDLTRIKGSQWAAQDFAPVAPAEAQSKVQIEVQIEVQSEVSGKVQSNVQSEVQFTTEGALPVAESMMGDVARRREEKRRLSASLDEDGEPPSITQILLQKLGVPTNEDDEEWLEQDNRRGLTAESHAVSAEAQRLEARGS